MKQQLQEMSENLHLLIEHRYNLRNLNEKRHSTVQQIEIVSELAAKAAGTNFESHPLYSVSQRYGVFKKYKDDFSTINTMMNEKVLEYAELLRDYQTYSAWSTKHTVTLDAPLRNEFEIVKDFLLNSNQNSIFSSGHSMVKEYDALEVQCVDLIRTTFDIVHKYSEVSQFLPPDYCNFYCVPKHLDWLRQVTQSKTVDTCQKVRLQYQMSMNALECKTQLPHIFTFACQLQELQNEANAKIQLLSEEYKRSMDGVGQYKELEKCLMAGKNPRISVPGMIYDTVRKSLLLEQNNTTVDVDIYCDFILTITPLTGLSKGSEAMKFLKTVKYAYSTLETLQDAFYAKVVPNTLRGIFSGDQTVLDMIAGK